MTLHRRAFLLGAVTALAAPAIVRASSLMPLYVPPAPVLSLAPRLAVADPEFMALLSRELLDAMALRSNWRAGVGRPVYEFYREVSHASA